MQHRLGLIQRPFTLLLAFLRSETGGGFLLIAASLLALVWANSPWQDGYAQLWSTRIAIDVGSHGIDLDLRGWINDGLMAIFFFVVGLEIKRELVEGELREPRRAALPAIAAVGGTVETVRVDGVLAAAGIDPATFEEVRQREVTELRRRESAYRDGRPAPAVEGRSVIVVDDGLATGATMRAAVVAVRNRSPRTITSCSGSAR